jgi:CelD/BcsL family acetyltransferase involved in cellulose biosynthesis
MNSPYTFSLRAGDEFLSDKELCTQLLDLVIGSDNANACYQTPQWLQYLLHNGGSVRIAECRTASGHLVGALPLARGECDLSFDVKGKDLWKQRFRCMIALGSLPLLPPDRLLYDTLFSVLRGDAADADCIYCYNVPVGSYLWAYLHSSKTISDQWLVHLPLRFDRYYTINLPATFKEYLRKFRRKRRQELMREVGRFQSRMGKEVRLVRIESPHQVAMFLENALVVSRESWQRRFLDKPVDQATGYSEYLRDMASAGLLRSYLLMAGEEPCAVALGFRLGDIYRYFETAYDPRFAQYSPGKVLLNLMIQDLFEWNSPGVFSFGGEHWDYKKWFANAHDWEAPVMLFKNTLRNRLWTGTHRLFQSSLRGIKRILRRPAPDDAPEGVVVGRAE